VSTLLAGKIKGDGLVWFAYPKGTSKKYTCDFNRDTGWSALGALGFEPVRMVAIEQNWSALRFRRIEYIKTMTRQTRLTAPKKVHSTSILKSSLPCIDARRIRRNQHWLSLLT
jgi:hypothetical protein